MRRDEERCCLLPINSKRFAEEVFNRHAVWIGDPDILSYGSKWLGKVRMKKI
jgi:hypothetical protein